MDDRYHIDLTVEMKDGELFLTMIGDGRPVRMTIHNKTDIPMKAMSLSRNGFEDPEETGNGLPS